MLFSINVLCCPDGAEYIRWCSLDAVSSLDAEGKTEHLHVDKDTLEDENSDSHHANDVSFEEEKLRPGYLIPFIIARY